MARKTARSENSVLTIAGASGWKTRRLENTSDFATFWNQVDILTAPVQKIPHYIVGFSASDRAVQAAMRLRYRVFNIELNEGLAASTESGLDQDAFDAQMSHVLVLDAETREVVGTYRIQPVTVALKGIGLYSAQEYDLSPLKAYYKQALELGRACTSREHRKAAALLALWQGLHVYASLFRLRWLFGCCSLTSTDPDDGWRAMKTLRDKNYLHPELMLKTLPDYSCGDSSREYCADIGPAIPLPRLFNTYMRLGGKVVSEPAIDREFGTVDFLVLLDGAKVQMSSLGLKQNG
ncbi:MAG: GNAT family N-acetyltransferase [Candidatus Sumerlaeia bacterium]